MRQFNYGAQTQMRKDRDGSALVWKEFWVRRCLTFTLRDVDLPRCGIQLALTTIALE
jgi:hypothetical protein